MERVLKVSTAVVPLFVLFLLTACLSPTIDKPSPTSTNAPPSPESASFIPTWTPLPTERDRWPELLQHTPVPWTTPLPPSESTILDGTYVKNDPSDPQQWNCRRCPDYVPAGGLWKLNLDKGVFRIYYTVTGWRSLGSFTVDGDRLYLFNDPYCQWDTGVYTWQMEDGQLVVTEVDDPCSTTFRLRASNLTKQPWLACQPPAGEAATGDRWSPPPGC